jgi:hypothetical protein
MSSRPSQEGGTHNGEDEDEDEDEDARNLGQDDADDPMSVLTCSEYGDQGAAQILFRTKVNWTV